jgi:acyl-CoA synthetase (AMP-forming)/AMP-acid ligase II
MNDTSALVRVFLRTAHAHPDGFFLDGEQQVTYRSAAEQVAEQAQQFRLAANGSPLVIQGPNTAAWVLSFLAARAAGLVVIPVSPEATTDQGRELGELVGPFYFFDTAQQKGELRNADGKRRQLPRRVGFCLLTSGSTGLPQLVLRSDRSLITEGERYLRGFGFAPADRIVVALPLCHAFILGLALGGALVSGCTLYLTPRFIPRVTQRVLREGKASILPLVPATARLVCEVFQDDGPAPRDVRHIIIGAGPVSPELEHEVIARLGRVPARNYGSSETGATLGTTGQMVGDGVTGAVLPGVEAVIMGEERPGSLFVRMEEPFLGYLAPDTIDARRVSPDGWYSTGDFATQDAEGWIHITGRIGEGLRRGGRFIHPAEVERAVSSHPAVTDVVIIGRRDAYGEDLIEAHIETGTEVHPPIDSLRQHAAQLLESYKIPTVWHFHVRFPRTSGGKPDRAHLAERTVSDALEQSTPLREE